MLKICKICGKEFEPKVYNASICYEEHSIPCRICNKLVNIDGDKNKVKRKMYLSKGFVYCSHECSCMGIGRDRWSKENEGVDLEKLKYLKTQTSMYDVDIAKKIGKSVDFVVDRCKRFGWERPDNLKQELQEHRNLKISNTLAEKYKDKDVKQSMLAKAASTYKAKTGHEHNFKNPNEIKKYKKIKQERYNNPTYTNPKKMIQTRRNNNDGVFWSNKQKDMLREAYKVNKYKINEYNIKEKSQNTKFERYGNKFYVNPEKISETWKNKSEVELITIRNKHKENWANKTPEEKKAFIDKVKKAVMNKYGVDNVFKLPSVQQQIKVTNIKRYGTEHPILLFNKNNNKTISNLNKKAAETLKLLGCGVELEKVIGSKSFDILIKPNTLIEIDPTYTHSSTNAFYMSGSSIPPKDPNYHLLKTQLAEENGYRCIHIFDWDNIDKILYSMKPKENIYARKCEVRLIDTGLACQFEDTYHYQNSCRGQEICIGLVYNNNLVQVMTFGKPRYNKNYEWELLRLCTTADYNVIGGSEKLFKYFLDTYNGSIVSYCDLSKFSGNVYSKLGFTLKSSGKPSKHWYNSKTERHITDNYLRQRGFSQLHGDSKYEKYKKGDSNEQLMLENGYSVVYDCGQATYVYKRKEIE